jgi:single-strand DNA-binding protein
MINKVILLGRLGKDPLIKHLDNGRVVANVTLATNDYYTKDGQRMESTEWHNLELWDNHAKMAEKYLRKGNVLYVEGKIRTDKFTDAEGNEKQVKKIRVLQMQMMGGMNRQDGEESYTERTQTHSEGYEQEPRNYGDDNRHEPINPADDELPF